MKKVVIIAYYWPPAGGPGVQRWLKFVKYLPDYGIEPIVFVPENPSYPIIDAQLLDEVPQGVTVLKQKIVEPYNIASLFSKKNIQKISSGIIPNKRKQTWIQKTLLWIRGNFFIPDARVLWVNPSVKYLKSYLQQHQIETIITTGPPHSLHLIGLALKKQMAELQWIADFRDPWTSIGYHKELLLTISSQEKHKRQEKEVLQTADAILVTSPSTQKEFSQLTTKPIEVITNGYDIEKIAKKPLDTEFTLAHIGSLLSERNPRILWKALAELIKEHSDFKQDFKLKLIGKVSQEVLATLEEFKLKGFVQNLGYVSHNEALMHQRISQVLLLIEIDSEVTKSIIPGKLFEYMVSERPILAIGPEESDFEQILKTTNTGSFFKYDEKEALKDKIWEFYLLYKQQQLKVFAVGLQQYSRKKLTEKLANCIDKL